MSSTQFDHVTVIKKSNVYFGGACISHTVQFEDGTKKTLGVIFRAGQSFYVPGNSVFKIETDEVLDYVCHLEG